VSIEDFGKLSEKTQQAYIELSQRVVQGSQEIVASTGEIQQAAARGAQGTQALGGGLDDVSQKSGISSREMRALGKIMGSLGAGSRSPGGEFPESSVFAGLPRRSRAGVRGGGRRYTQVGKRRG
jgi:hypothetical protein